MRTDQPPRQVRIRAPPARVYSSEPSLRQVRFTPRGRVTMALTAPPSFGTVPKQSPFTQLDFARAWRDSHSEGDKDSDMRESDEEKKGEEFKHKRRRVARDVDEEKRQCTLTQIGFFVAATDSDGEGDEDDIDVNGEEGTNPEVPDEETVPKMAPQTMDCMTIPMKEETESQQTWNTAPLHQTPEKVLDAEAEHTLVSTLPQPAPIFKTPEKRIKREIPSSQTPPATPLTLFSPSRASSQRAPLQEIPANVVAMRDISPSPKARKPRATLQRAVPRPHGSENEDEENVDPNPMFTMEKCNTEAEPEKPFNDDVPFQPTAQLAGSPPHLHTAQHLPASRRHSRAPEEVSPNPRNRRPHSSLPHSSQATTVDLTQLTPRQLMYKYRSPSPSSFNLPASPSVRVEESQFPFSEDLNHYSPLSSVRGSDDMVTISQFCSISDA